MKSLSRIISLVAVAGLLLTLSFCVGSTKIKGGYEGVLIEQYGSNKGVQEANLVTGRVWYNPLTQDVDQYPTFIQTIDYTGFKVQSKDGSTFSTDPTMSYRIRKGHSPAIYIKYRKDIDEISETTAYTYLKDAFRIVLSRYTVDEIVSNKEKVENEVQNYLSLTLDKDGFELVGLTSGLTPPDAITNAITAKNGMIQKAMEAENKVRLAEANAKILLINAEAEKKANELKQQSLTPMLIQKMFIEKWDGRTALYGSSPTLFKNVN